MTAITKLIIGGFKSIRDLTEIPFAPVTFLFGPNSAGKSAVLDAMDSMRKRLQETPHAEGQYDGIPERNGAPTIGAGLFGREIHKLAGSIGETHFTNATFGVEIEDFAVMGRDCGGGTEEAHICASACLHAVDSSTVEVRIVERLDLERAASSIRIDDKLLLCHDHCYEAKKHGDADDLTITVSSSTLEHGWETNRLGVLKVNLAHPLWKLFDLKGTQVNRGRGPSLANMRSEIERREMLWAKLVRLKDVAVNSKSEFLSQLVHVDGEFLFIRSVTFAFKSRGWSQGGIHESQGADLPQFLASKGVILTEEQSNEYRTAEALVDWIVAATNFFAEKISRIAGDALERTAVSGDRGVLRDGDVEFSFPWNLDKEVVRATNHGSEWDGSIGNYAYWLGVNHILGCNELENLFFDKEQSHKDFRKDDFVNDVISGLLFEPRRYVVSAAVWMKESFNLFHPIAEENDGHQRTLKVKLFLKDANDRVLKFNEVGSGISYVLPVLSALWGAKVSWLAQPELHLHPAAQCEMGDAIIRAFNRGRFSITETHSEHMLLRVLRRIRQTSKNAGIDPELRLLPEAVSVLYFDPQADGSTRVKQLRVSRLGDFADRWPNGFFEERGRELFDE